MVDASVLVNVVADDEHAGVIARGRVADETIVAPGIADIEVVATIRRLTARGDMPRIRAEQAIDNLRALPVVYVPHRVFLPRIWELRDNLTAYDAAYVALAEGMDAPLVTGDRRLERAPGPRCVIEVLS